MPYQQQTYRVFYAQPPYDLLARRVYGGLTTIFSVEKLEKTHVFLYEVLATSLEDVYWQLQGENWSPQGEARPFIERLGLRHTSLNSGDVVQVPTPDGRGQFFVCAPAGWEELSDTEPLVKADDEDLSLVETLTKITGIQPGNNSFAKFVAKTD